jgi:hypothetical protein
MSIAIPQYAEEIDIFFTIFSQPTENQQKQKTIKKRIKRPLLKTVLLIRRTIFSLFCAFLDVVCVFLDTNCKTNPLLFTKFL